MTNRNFDLGKKWLRLPHNLREAQQRQALHYTPVKNISVKPSSWRAAVCALVRHEEKKNCESPLQAVRTVVVGRKYRL